jgi:cytochrome c551/c552
MKYFIASMIAAAGLMAGGCVWAIDMPPLAKKNDCVACHAMNTKGVGPAWIDISRMYKGMTKYTYRDKEYPLLEGLVMKVSKGGAGSWGTVPMPGNATVVKEADIRELVQFILGLAK